jgi:peptidoglycan/LPS O-acetylase OafA/YrhL
VVLNHMSNWPKGGFVGVDIFFVISGYLITGLLLREHDRNGSISFTGFYIRRIKRILPAGLLTLLATVVGSYALLPRTRFHDATWDAIWSTFFVGNWRFVEKSTDYFAQGLLPSPVQHFWSLGVEEQFYVVWPWLMLGVLAVGHGRLGWSRRTGRIALVATIGAITVVSFLWAVHESSTNTSSAYFSTLTRAWELGIGALLAIALADAGPARPALRTALSWVGLVGMITSLFVVSSTHGFPAPWAALPVLSTGLVIAAGAGGPTRIWPLTNPVSHYLGDISYSLYLWHFPVVVLLLAVTPGGTAKYYASCVAIMLVLAVASYHLIENPVRRSAWLTSRPGNRLGWRIAIAAMVAGPVIVGSLLIASSRQTDAVAAPRGSCVGAQAVAPGHSCQVALSSVLTPSVDKMANDIGNAFHCWTGEGGPIKKCTYGSTRPDALHVALVGDSHAAMMIPALSAEARSLNWQLDTYVGFDCAWQVGAGGVCAHQMAGLEHQLATGPKYAVVLTTADRQFDTARSVAEVKAAWKPVQARGTRIVVITDNPGVSSSTLECLQRVTGSPAACVSSRSSALSKPDEQVVAAKQTPGIKVVDLTSFYCHGSSCPAVIGNVIVYRDTYGHVTATWSRSIAPYLVAAIRAQL